MAAGLCESCGAPRPPNQKLCDTCTWAFASVLEAETPAAAAHVAPPPIPSVVEPPAPVATVAPVPASPALVAGAANAAGDEPFPAVRQPWERKDEPADTTGIGADEAEPLPWWERQTNPNATSADATAPDLQAPQPSFAPPPLPAAARPAARPPASASAPIAMSDAPRRTGPRPMPRPPTPGNITRPAQQSSGRRPMYVLGASLVVLMAAVAPVAKGWLRPTPTVTVSDFGPEPPAAARTPLPDVSRALGRRATPAAEPRPTVSVEPSVPAAPPADPPRARTRPEPTRQLAKGERPAHAVLARNAFNASSSRSATATPSASAPAAAAPTPEPEPVVEAPPAPAETADVVPTGPVFEMGQVDDKPSIASQVDPSLPEELRDRPLTDLVIVRVLVSQAGRAADVNVLRKSKAGAALDSAVVSAVRKWSFSPARKRGQPVSCWYNVGIPLRLEGRTSPE